MYLLITYHDRFEDVGTRTCTHAVGFIPKPKHENILIHPSFPIGVPYVNGALVYLCETVQFHRQKLCVYI